MEKLFSSLQDSNIYPFCSCEMIILYRWTKQLFSNNFIIFLECFFLFFSKTCLLLFYTCACSSNTSRCILFRFCITINWDTIKYKKSCKTQLQFKPYNYKGEIHSVLKNIQLKTVIFLYGPLFGVHPISANLF